MRWFAAVLVLAACGSDAGGSEETTGGSESSTGDSSTTTAVDESTSSTSTDESSSSSSTGTTAVQCGDVLVPDTTFEVDPLGVTTQIQAFVSFDAEAQGIWTVYNLPSAEGTGLFDVFVTRLGCDGQQQIEPLRINQTSGRNNIDAELARAGDELLVVWSSDDSTGGANNLDIFVQSLDAAGTPRLESDVTLETEYEGDPVPGSAWMPRVAANAVGGFTIIGSRAVDAASTFQVFLQSVDADGTLVGDAIAPPLAVGRSQTQPHLAMTSTGEALVAWQGSEDADLDQIEHAHVLDGEFSPDPPAVLEQTDSSGAAIALDPGGEGGYLAFSIVAGSGRQIQLRRAEIGGVTDPVLLGSSAGLHHTPSIAAGPGGGAIAWYANISGLDNELRVARIVDGGAVLSVMSEATLQDVVAAPYPTTITHLVDDVYAVAWSEGDSPDFRLYVRFVDLG